MSATDEPADEHRRSDWRGDRVMLTGRVDPMTRERARAIAARRGQSVGELLEQLLDEHAGERPGTAAGPVEELRLPPLPAESFGTILADPPWRFANRTGKVAPEHQRLSRYDTMTLEQICALPVAEAAAPASHLYLWCPNALMREGLEVMAAWGFTYKTNLIWHKVRKDGGSDGRGVGFYFRNVTELILFGVRGSLRTGPPGRSQVNYLATRKREHSRKPDELYPIIEACSPGPRLEMFARYPQEGWSVWGDESAADVVPRGRAHRGYGEADAA